MSRTISTEETEELSAVCRDYGVVFYDVQIELVDHLASLIEGQWEETSELDFQDALKSAVSIFGKSNFTKMVRRKEKEVNRKYNILLWKYFVEFYKWPKLLITISATLGLFILIQLTNEAESIIFWYSVFVSSVSIFYFITLYPKYKIKNPSGKLFLIVVRQNQMAFLFLFVVLLPIFLQETFQLVNAQFFENKLVMAGASLILAYSSILYYATMYYLPQKIKEHFKEQFPEFVK